MWANQGFITTTEGNFIGHNAIEADIRALCEAHQVEKIRLEHYVSVFATSGGSVLVANLLAGVDIDPDGHPSSLIYPIAILTGPLLRPASCS